MSTRDEICGICSTSSFAKTRESSITEEVLIVLSRRKRRLTEIDEKELVLQVGETKWTIAENMEDYLHFVEKLLQCARKIERIQWIRGSTAQEDYEDG